MNRFTPILFSLLFALSFPMSLMAQTGATTATGKDPAPKTAEQIWANLAEGNKRFANGKANSHASGEQRQALATVQNPNVAVLSCSDSRVPPEIVFDQGLGDLFVVRSAGNNADPIGIGSLEYAVEHLGSTVIVVLGHQRCGAVKAACSGDKMPSVNLEAVVQPVLPSCSAGAKSDKQGDPLESEIRDHVHRTAETLLARSPILKHAAAEGKLSIVEAYYELDTGRVVRMH